MPLPRGTFRIFKILLIVALILSLGAYISQTDLQQIRALISQMGWGYIWIVGITFVALLCGTASWAATLPSTAKINFWRLFYIRLIGENIGLINPSNIIGGDAMKAFLMGKEGLSYTQSSASLLISRIIMICVQITLFFVAIGLFFFMVAVPAILLQVMLWLVLGIGVLAVLSFVFYKRGLPRVISQYQWFNNLRDVKEEINNYYHTQRHQFYKAIAWSTLNFLIGSLEFVAIFYFLGRSITYVDALLVDQGVLVLKSFGAFVPGQIGVEEYANKLMFGFIGISSSSLWVAASILRRSRQLFWIAVSIVLYYIQSVITKSQDQLSAINEPLKS